MAKARVLYMQPNDSTGLLDLHFTATGETKQRVLERNPRVTGGDTATIPFVGPNDWLTTVHSKQLIARCS